jgi:hypothetical protein
VVERTLAWFARHHRIAIRYERRSDIFEAFHHLAAALICQRFVQRSWSAASIKKGLVYAALALSAHLASGPARLDESGSTSGEISSLSFIEAPGRCQRQG